MGDTTNEGLFSQIIDFFPYPMAIFTPDYTLAMVNRVFTEETKMQYIDPEKESAKILLYKIDDMQLAAAVTQVFDGNTIFLEHLKNPFSMFSGICQLYPNSFNKAVIFPIPTHDAVITHGVIVFMS